MTIDIIWKGFLFFLLVSHIGWYIETTYRSLLNWRIVNAGILKGPFVPIYGTAGTLILFLSRLAGDFPLVGQILLFALLATVLEYMTSYLLESLFGVKLWDYSGERWNIRGRICLRFSIYWVVLVAFYLLLLQGPLWGLVSYLGETVGIFLAVIMAILFSIDIIYSFKILRSLNSLLKLFSSYEKDYIGGLELDTGLEVPKVWERMRSLIWRFPQLSETFMGAVEQSFSDMFSHAGSHINTFRDPGTDEGFMDKAAWIMGQDVYIRLKDYPHHDDTIYDHSVRVAYLSYLLGRRMSTRMKIDMDSLVRGALLHDLFFYDWRTEIPDSGERHAFSHPKEALKNANRYFGPMNEIEEDMILCHMWPLNNRLPKHLETCILIIVDKFVATREFMAESVARKEQDNRKS